MLTHKTRLSYRSLLDLQVLHRYFLCVGRPDGSVLDGVDYPAEPQAQALHRLHDVRQYLRFEPSPATQALLNQHRLRFQPTREGFSLVAPAAYDAASQTARLALPLPTGSVLEFRTYYTDPLFPIYTDVGLAELLVRHPRPGAVSQQSFVLDNQHFARNSARQYTYYQQAVSPGVILWTEPAPRPLFTLALTHDETQEGALHGPQGTLLATPLRYVLPLLYRSTRWYHQTADLGTHPLLRHGGVPLPGGLPNPTAVNTFYTKQDPADLNAPLQLLSYIY